MMAMTIRALMMRPSVREVLARVSTGRGVSHDSPNGSPNRGRAPTPAAEEAARAALARIAAAQMPWYLRALIAIGAWVGANFFISTILGLILMASGEMIGSVAVAIGIAFMSAATLFRRRVTGTFAAQLALVVSFTGQVLLIGGIGEATNSTTLARIVMIVSSLALIAFFPDRIQRFCATLAIFGAVGWYIVEHRGAFAPDMLAFALVALILALWRFAPRDRIEASSHVVEPVVFGLIVSLLIVLVIHTVVSMIDISESAWLRFSPFSIVTFTIALLALAAAISIEHGIALTEPLAAATLVSILVLGALTRAAPAIVASIMLIVLGFDRRSRMLIALATIFFLGFLAAFYYDMRLTLLQKSGMLMLTGSVCLTACVALRMRARTGDA